MVFNEVEGILNIFSYKSKKGVPYKLAYYKDKFRFVKIIGKIKIESLLTNKTKKPYEKYSGKFYLVDDKQIIIGKISQ